MDDLNCGLRYGFICETYAGKIQQIMKTFLRSKKTIKYKKSIIVFVIFLHTSMLLYEVLKIRIVMLQN